MLASLHDLGLAARHCSRLLMLDAGRLVADGTPEDVLTADNVERVFGVSSFYASTEHGPVFQPLEVVR